MSIEESIKASESSLIEALRSKQSGIDDRTGKGSAAEEIIEREIVLPHLPPRFRCCKGAVMAACSPTVQSPAIDRVIYDPTTASPLLFDKAHSIFPIESVCGLIEITMRLDRSKLREDIERMAPVKAMRRRKFLAPLRESNAKVEQIEMEWLSPRSFIVGLPEDLNWKPATIADALRSIQLELGSPTHVHGLYIIGIGFFETLAVESGEEPTYRVRGWLGADRLFRFTTSLRQAFDRWPSPPSGWSVDLQDYVHGVSDLLAE